MKTPSTSTALFLTLLGSITTASIAFSPSMRSSFLGSSTSFTRMSATSPSNRHSLSMYDTSRDPPASPEFNAWSVLANTEKWISRTLADANASAGNPYSRKEVSYDCETSKDGPLIVAGLFRRLKEVREMGEEHGAREEEERLAAEGSSYEPRTLRLTQVVVMPSNERMCQSFHLFDKLIGTINQSRRQARDYVTDVALERTEDRMYDEHEDQEDWSVSVNCAHLHPKYGEMTPEQQLEEMKQQEEDGEIDLHYEDYKQKRMMARRSPYPSVVLEVRAVPPPDFGQFPPPASQGTSQTASSSSEPQEGVTSQDILKLEALFGKTAHTDHPSKELSPHEEEDAFYNAIGGSIEKQLTTLTPLHLAERWIASHDTDLGLPSAAAFTESSTPDVDAAYEYVFTNIAMMEASQDTAQKIQRQYLVMPRFLSAAATSFEKFRHQAQAIVDCLPDQIPVQVSTFHPEHVDSAKRSPTPILVLQWTGHGDDANE